MKPFGHGIALCAVLASLAAGGYEIPFGEGTAAGATDFYIVPAGADKLAFKCASIPIFTLSRSGDRYVGANGSATADASGDGRFVVVKHGDFMKAGPATMKFEDGRLKTFERDADEKQKAKDLALLTAHPKKQPTLAQLWRTRTEEQKEAAKARWWRGDSRLRLGYFNPNAAGTLFAELAVLFAALTLCARRRAVKALSAVATLASLHLIFLTGSRGSFVAWLAGVAVLAACFAGKRLARPKALLCALLALIAAAGAMVAVDKATDGRFGSRLVALDAGNVQRLQAWKAAPEMMTCAPRGWGEEPGRAYCDWFQDTGNSHRLYYLVNSHLTWLAQYGRAFRCAYMSAWLALFAILAAFARERAVRVALASWASFAVALWFSTVGIFPTLWILPGLCAAAAAVSIWRTAAVGGFSIWKTRLPVVAAAVAVGCALSFALEAIGKRQSEIRDTPVFFDGGRVVLGRGEPRIAVLRDDTVLSGNSIGAFGHELRNWLADNRGAGSVAVADDPAALPANVDCLVAAGKAGARYIRHRRLHLPDGDFCHARRTVFLSPPFPPSEIPHTLRSNADVRIVIGEFAAKLSQEYSQVMPWVRIMPGCELFVPGWIELALAESAGGGS